MSRAGAPDTVYVKAGNNLITALVVIATIANIVAFIAMFMKAKELFPPDGLM